MDPKSAEQLLQEQLQNALAKNQELSALIQKLQTESDDKDVQIAELEARLKEAASKEVKSEGPVHVEHEGKKYQVLVPKINVPGHGVRTALELQADEEAVAALVEVNSGAIKEIED